MNSIPKYSAVFGRPPAVVREPTGRWAVSALMFPPLKRSFWRGLLSEAHDQAVYVTSGMSQYPMPGGAARMELIAFSEAPIGGGPSGVEDVPSAVLQLIANYVLDEELVIGVGHTLDFQDRLATNTSMTGVLFTPADGVDEKRVCRCTQAQELLNVVLLTADELMLARSEGVLSLLDKLEAAQVRPVFDYRRSSAL